MYWSLYGNVVINHIHGFGLVSNTNELMWNYNGDYRDCMYRVSRAPWWSGWGPWLPYEKLGKLRYIRRHSFLDPTHQSLISLFNTFGSSLLRCRHKQIQAVLFFDRFGFFCRPFFHKRECSRTMTFLFFLIVLTISMDGRTVTRKATKKKVRGFSNIWEGWRGSE